jgi:uncharacterized RDD family membrane protein YckC
MYTEQPTHDLLTLEEVHVRASAGKRFANYIVDLLMFYILIFTFGVVIALASPTAAELFTDSPGFAIADRFITLILYALYMGTVEALFKGKSLGKLVTGTRAVNLDGSRISTGTAFLRGLSRAVPFCAFSAFGTPSNPWQDRWTDTMVIEGKNKLMAG